MIVSISRELGAGGGTLGEALARALSAALLDERWFIAELTARYQFSSDYLAEPCPWSSRPNSVRA